MVILILLCVWPPLPSSQASTENRHAWHGREACEMVAPVQGSDTGI